MHLREREIPRATSSPIVCVKSGNSSPTAIPPPVSKYHRVVPSLPLIILRLPFDSFHSLASPYLPPSPNCLKRLANGINFAAFSSVAIIRLTIKVSKCYTVVSWKLFWESSLEIFHVFRDRLGKKSERRVKNSSPSFDISINEKIPIIVTHSQRFVLSFRS